MRDQDTLIGRMITLVQNRTAAVDALDDWLDGLEDAEREAIQTWYDDGVSPAVNVGAQMFAAVRERALIDRARDLIGALVEVGLVERDV